MLRVFLPILTGALMAFATATAAADLGVAPPLTTEKASDQGVETALSRYLALEMVRATFDVISPEEIKDRLEEELRRWGGVSPSPEATEEIDRQLLAEASYYLVSLSYVVQVGGAAFPDDKSETSYANDTLVRIDSLQRQLVEAIAGGGDIFPILTEAEAIRALTEGYRSVPANFGVFSEYPAILAEVAKALKEGTQI